MARASRGKMAIVSALAGNDRRTLRRWLFIWMALVGLGWFGVIPLAGCSTVAQQSTAAGAAGAPTAPALDANGNPIPPPPKGDPSGSVTGDVGDAADSGGNTFVPAEPKEPARADFKTEQEYNTAVAKYKDAKAEFDEFAKQSNWQTLSMKLGKAVGHNRVAINMMWTLITGFLVMFMQAGFALVETGLTRAKNASHTMAMNFLIYPLGMLGFYVCGYAFMFGGSGSASTMGGPAVMDGVFAIKGWNIIGTKGYFLSGTFYDVSVFALFFFQMVFMDTTATIPTGAAAERWKFSAFVLYGLFLGTIMYPIYGNWVWGGGWCSQLGAKLGWGHGTCDYAGSSVVHLQGGIIAFWFAKLIGPRVGKYNKDGSANVIPAHNVPMCVLGTFILAFGWFGFNPGSSLAGTDLRIAMSVVNTMLASATGAMFATFWVWKVRGNKPDTTMMCNGMLAGLVAITAPCAYVNSISACIIGAISGIVVVESVFFIERKLKIDDPVGAISVHGANGLWGVLSVGLFADGTYPTWGQNGVDGPVKGLFYGDAGQLLAQATGATACIVYVSLISIAVYYVIEKTVGNRVSKEVELEGLDLPEMGIAGYCGVVLDKASETPVSKGWDEPPMAPKVPVPTEAPEEQFVDAWQPPVDGKSIPTPTTRPD